MNESSKIELLIVDDDEQFSQELKEEIQSHSDNIEIDTASDFKYCTYKHDVYICSQYIHSKDCLEQIQKIKDIEPEASVFVVIEAEDFEFIKKLFKINISGIIDKNSLDISSLLEQAKDIIETRFKIQKMTQKLNGI